MNERADAPLGQLLDALRDAGYRFTSPTPETHRRVIGRRDEAEDLRDVFGWSLPFRRETLPPPILGLLEDAGMVERARGLLKSRVRVASLGDCLFLHSAFPTDDADSVFFGPDSYRFARFLERELAGRQSPACLVDVGAGSGIGGIFAAKLLPGARPMLLDINPLALRFARINARHNGVEAQTVLGSGLDLVSGPIELAISNPPFMRDRTGRSYRDGGDMLGAGLSLEWALAGAAKLAPDGRFLLYSGSAIIGGEDRLEQALRRGLAADGFNMRYEEIDADIFGEELDEPGYENVERIAAVGAVIERTS